MKNVWFQLLQCNVTALMRRPHKRYVSQSIGFCHRSLWEKVTAPSLDNNNKSPNNKERHHL